MSNILAQLITSLQAKGDRFRYVKHAGTWTFGPTVMTLPRPPPVVPPSPSQGATGNNNTSFNYSWVFIFIVINTYIIRSPYFASLLELCLELCHKLCA